MSLTAAPSTTTLPDTRQGRELTQQALEQLATPEGWRSWLAVRAAMPQLSLPNQLLVAYQHPQATHLATFRTWLNRGYGVRRRPEDVPEGQYAVRVWEPKPPSRAQLAQWRAAGSDPGLYPQTVFRLTNEFAQDQVAPADGVAQRVSLDPVVRDLAGEDLAPVLSALLARVMELKADHATELARLEAAFDQAGGRGVELAERIDRLRADLEDLARHTLGPITAAPAVPANLAVTRLCRAAAHLLVSAEPAQADSPPPVDACATAAAVAWVCIRGLGLDPDALDVTNGSTPATTAMPLVPLRTATVVDRLARRLETAARHDIATAQAA